MSVDNLPLNKGESHTGSEPIQRPVPSDPSSSDHPPAYETRSSLATPAVPTSSEVEPALSSSFIPPALVAAPHVSHVMFLSTNGSVKKEINIDLRSPVPQLVLNKQPTTHELNIGPAGEKVHVYMNSQNGSVKGTFAIWGHGPDDQNDAKVDRIRTVLRSTNGAVSSSYYARKPTTTRVTTHASSENGSITLYLPPAYCGPILSFAKNGSLKLSARAKATYSPMGYHPTGSGSSERSWEFGFIGDRTEWNGELENDAGNVSDENMKKPSRWDESWASSQNGNIYIRLGEELADDPEPGLGSKLFGSISKAIWGA
ncbi:hypothetical protein [Phaffia rhodozyma]|uniref:DUF7330 domain-containing protein n=1 Tax=Phaffia rhodozyma TaxID=264483 RepID=A0A0F7SG32_PHARH|nr:hypothetical protein [Phaffia rhodozyma]